MHMNEVEEDVLDRLSVAGTETNSTADTDCTFASVMTMNKLVNKWDRTPPVRKEMLAIYNATTEVIKANGGQRTDTEYFALLMATLEAVGTDVSRTSAAALFAIFANRVPAAVLRKKFSWITTLCIKFLQMYRDPVHIKLLQSVLLEKCFQNCLENEADPTSKSSLCYTAGVKVIEHMQRALHCQFLPAWDYVLSAWATCFESHCSCYQDHGPEVVLKAVPLDMSGEESRLDLKRSWMLRILRDNIKATRLSFFITYFLPLASAFHELGALILVIPVLHFKSDQIDQSDLTYSSF
ncbi:hypothetical protein V5799_010414 [Amblyomma americanum]|uniref:RRP12 HEAT domain-containing protein n=1 Tax=Amblyomma americanum TaxID=6943 RepID=A0AAQ4EJW1_AMBAM